MAVAKLKFGSTSDITGQSPVLSQHKGEKPEIYFRELIQNGLDAKVALNSELNKASIKNTKPCQIKFIQKKINTTDIPGIDEYKKSIDVALKTHKNDSSTTKFLKNLQNEINKPKTDILFIVDNGIGFDANRIEAVLSDGSSVKTTSSTGAFGAGHLTTYALSNLNYIFYASKNLHGDMLAAGHAITSSHRLAKEDTFRSHNGYYLVDHTFDKDNHRGYCKTKKQIPKFILDQLNQIKESGSIVCILGFDISKIQIDNVKEKLDDIVKKSAAVNFTVAINNKSLEIQCEGALNSKNLVEFLEKTKNNIANFEMKKVRLALEVLKTIGYNEKFYGNLDKPFADCEIQLRNHADNTNVSIWRNGMLITVKEYYRLKAANFSEKIPFNAVVQLYGDRSITVAHDLIRDAERPLHNELAASMIDSKEVQNKFHKLINEMRVWLNKNAKDVDTEQQDLFDEIMIQTGSAQSKNLDPTPPSLVFEDKTTDPDEDDPEPNTSDQGNKKAVIGKGGRDKTQSRPPRSKARTAGKFKNKKYLVRIIPLEKMDVGILEIIPKSGIDPSSEGRVSLDRLEILNAKSIDNSDLSIKKISNTQIEISNLKKNEKKDIEISFKNSMIDVEKLTLFCNLYNKNKLVANN